MNEHGGDPADAELARMIRDALARERTPAAWVDSALAMARGTEMPRVIDAGRNPRRADFWLPVGAGGALLAGLGAALYTARGAMSAFLGAGEFPSWWSSLSKAISAGGAAGAGHGFGGLHPLALVAVAVLPPAIAFALAESVRGFPLVRRWFA